MGYRIEVDTSELRHTLERARQEKDRRMREIIERVGERTVEYLRSYTHELRPGRRPAHPGGWADITGRLAASYGFEVRRAGPRWELAILNTAPYAPRLEARDAFFVVRGVGEKGGPVDRALRKAIREVAPEWEYT